MLNAMPAILFSAHRKILHAEDDFGLRKIFSEILPERVCPEGDTIEIKQAASLNEAKALLDSDTFDAVITDNRMPLKDEGLAFLEYINQKENKPPILTMHSGDSGKEEQVKTLGGKFFDKSRLIELLDYLKEQLTQLEE